jgi:hypothetical protein
VNSSGDASTPEAAGEKPKDVTESSNEVRQEHRQSNLESYGDPIRNAKRGADQKTR